MSGLRIDRQQCDGCGLCGQCVDSCPQGAIALEQEAEKNGLTGWKGVWVFVQHREGLPLPVSLELLSKGRELAGRLGEGLSAVLLGGDRGTVEEVSAYGPDRVYHCADPYLANNEERITARLLAGLVRREKPAILLFGATGLGRSLAPRLAARLGTGLTADCTSLEINAETGLLEQTRPAFGGNLMATILCPEHRPQMATV
ncbi:MAG: electron transfer flavoprotein subunit alpha, partial [Oscillospiraceae bacterium]|nr:electron transfer flavoprotein subunit alpha [Oscillospiraceae bacterium]